MLKLIRTVKNNIFTALKGSIIFTWILSYLAITLLSMLCNGIIYYRAKNAIKNELAANCVQAMDKFKMSVDNTFVSTSNLAKSLQKNNNITSLYNLPEGTPYSEYSGEAFSVTRKLSEVLQANTFLSEIYIYYRNIDLVTSSRYMYTKERFYEQVYGDSDMTYEVWTSMFDKNTYASVNMVHHSDNNRQTMDVYYQMPEFFDKFDAMVVLSINTSVLLDSAKMAMTPYSDVGMFILSKDNKVLMTNGVVDRIPESSKDSTVISTVSDTLGWRYVAVIPAKEFYKKLDYFKLANITNIIICLILCGILSYFFAKKNARPFSELKQIYNNKDEKDMTLINDVLNDYRNAKQTQSELEQAHLMGGLISTGQPEILNELKKYNIDFPYRYFCVILFKLVNVSRLFEDENDISSLKKYDAVKLIIKNVLEEIINEKYYAYICKINGQIVAVVNINHDYMLDFHGDIEEMLRRGKDFISSNFAFSYTPFVGGIHDVKALHKSYSEAINALQYRTFIPTSDIVFCDEADTENSQSEVTAIIPAEKTKQLVNLLQLGDLKTSLSMINSLLRTAPRESPIKYRVFLFDLISTLIRVVESVDKDDDIETKLSDELCRLAGDCDASDIPERINEIITRFCELRTKKNQAIEEKEIKENLSKKDIVSEMKKFIRDNYANQELNIALIGEYFNITPYYVSNLFKKSENISMLDYINITRIDKAKELLVSTDLTLESIALQCGFSNIRTFMRVFQKFEIITPGKYKEINKK